MYDEIARSYDELYKKEQLNKLKIISRILKVKESDKLLDIGAGTGISTNYFRCQTYGVEPSLQMIKHGNGNLINAAAENLPFRDNCFDIVIAVTSVHNFSDLDLAIKEIKRVVKKNGKIIITLMKKSIKFKDIKRKLLNNFNFKQITEVKDVIFYTE